MKPRAVCAQWLRTCVLAAGLALPGNIWATTHVVQFGGSLGFVYSPASFTAKVGDTVEWEGDFSTHPLSSTTIPVNSQSWLVTSGTSFRYRIAVAGTYHYQCNVHFSIGMVGSFQVDATGIRYQASPEGTGPADPMTIVSFTTSGKPHVNFVVSRAGPVTLKIFDPRGREVATVLNRILQEGTYSVSLGLEMKAGGLYCVRLIGNNPSSSGIFYIP